VEYEKNPNPEEVFENQKHDGDGPELRMEDIHAPDPGHDINEEVHDEL